MARAEFGTAKYQAKKLKASGLQKLRFYCQICAKQCRDANGFKNHLNSPSHKGRVENASSSKYNIVEDFSTRFLNEFLRLLKVNHGTKEINANKFYQEYILNDKDHIHMNSTKWSSLTSFVRFLGKNGYVRVEQEAEDDEFALVIRYIDSSVDVGKKAQSKEEAAKEEKLSLKRLQEQIRQGQENLEKFELSKEPAKIENPNQPVRLQLKKTTKKIIRRSAFDDADDDDDQD